MGRAPWAAMSESTEGSGSQPDAAMIASGWLRGVINTRSSQCARIGFIHAVTMKPVRRSTDKQLTTATAFGPLVGY